ncbi:chromosomal replication initiator protein DnaA, DNA-binding transcriptional dual regulator [uncultured Alphaproteobacteria bacterium]|uniref:Chromosomal replication initiator protein DnaA n=1 Tax=uncultured Alphaproteobacteria bacterium TaxID=91750 RepID=A0A212K9F5_9PROT|nr:chromosomal replication initiator protein DnaA, DNA-binding transcriptional dual regulator [uncultured Alphaproteobacteria bacterium]
MEQQWERVQDRLRGEIGDAAFRNWLQPIRVVEAHEDAVCLGVPTRFIRDWVMTHYASRIREVWAEVQGAPMEVSFVVQPVRRAAGGMAEPDPASAAEVIAVAAAPEPPEDREAMPAPLDRRFTFDSFVVGKPNEFAWAAARRVAESDVPPFNPLFLYSGVGLGKTHLMHAIAWHIRERDPGRTVGYLSAEKFMYRFIRALRYHDMMNFKEQLRSLDVLMIDDVQFISDKDSTQEEFFHTFNALMDQGKQIVISADKSPAELQGIEERLKSRLGCGLVADIHPTSYELRLGILESKVEQIRAEQARPDSAEIVVPSKVLEFLAHKITTNVRELEGALRRVFAHAQLIGRDITLEGTQEVLHDLLRTRERHLTIDAIQKEVAQRFNIKIADMSSPRRARAVARPRQIAMYLSKQLTARSLPEIGRKFGGRDHTTVMHAVKKVEELIAQDPDFAEEVDLLRRMLEN